MIRRLVYTQKPFSTFEIAAGGDNTIALKANGSTWGWGGNASGQVGDNSIVDEGVPSRICGDYKTFCNIWAGSAIPGHSLALDLRGRAWAWGEGGSGQLGRNSTTDFSTPVSVCGAVKTFCHIDGCSTFSFGLTNQGRIWSWGGNTNGQLARNSTTNFSTPVSICGAVKTFCYVSAGNTMGAAIDKNGRIWTWGAGTNGQLGRNSTTAFSTPVSVCGEVKTFCKIATGSAATTALDKNGIAWSWGFGLRGALGTNAVTNFSTPVSVCGARKTFCEVARGGETAVVIDKYGKVWGWGQGTFGQLGTNTSNNFSTPVSVCGANKTFCKIAIGFGVLDAVTAYKGFTYAIDHTGLLWGWGYGAYLGIGEFNKTSTPTQIYNNQVRVWNKITAGETTGCGLTALGRGWCWGAATSGSLGNNLATGCFPSPVSVVGAVKTFCQISNGTTYSLSISNSGRVWAWGINTNGRLGDNSTTSRLTPVAVLGALKTFCVISAGVASAGITNSGRAFTWGVGTSGMRGDNTTAESRTPKSVAGATKTFCDISGGRTQMLSIQQNGRLWAWGAGTNGILGRNSTTNFSTPVSVCGGVKTFCHITLGTSHVAAIDNYGKVWTWGTGTSGALGRNSTTNFSTPVSVCGAAKTFCEISAGASFTVAIDQYGKIWSWGLNTSGRLGNNSVTDRSTPVSVCANYGRTFCKISTQNDFVLAIDSQGTGWAWGNPGTGTNALGNSTVVYTPIRISYM